MFGFLPLGALEWNLLNLFIWQKIANELHKNSMQIQRMLLEDAKNIISFVRKFDTSPLFSFDSNMNLQTFYGSNA